MSDIQIHFLDPINTYLGKAAFGAQAAARLSGFSDLPEEALRAAAEKVIANLTGTPKLAVLQKALQHAERAATVPLDTAPRAWDRETIDRLEWEAEQSAIRLIRQTGLALARAADRDGWLKRLVEFVTDHGRLPMSAEIEAFKSKSAKVRAEVERSDNGDLGPHVQALYMNMLDATGRKVLGDEAVIRSASVATLCGAQGRRAGTAQAERLRAEVRLKDLADDAPAFTLSPEAQKIFDKRH